MNPRYSILLLATVFTFFLPLAVEAASKDAAPQSAKRTEPAPAKPDLAAYVGHYELIPGFALIVREKGGALEAQAVGEGPLEIPTGETSFSLEHRSQDRFSAFEIGAEIDFRRDKTGKVDSFQIQQAGFTHHGKRKN